VAHGGGVENERQLKPGLGQKPRFLPQS
jgi:hypothetical protein